MGRGIKTLFIVIAIVIISLCFYGAAYYYREIYSYKTDYLEYVQSSSAEHEVDIYLIFSVIKVESSFNEKAKSLAGARGLMQVMPDTAGYLMNREITIDELYDPMTNINIGVMYLSYLNDRFDSLDWVLAAYNAGETKARQWQNEGIEPSDIPYLETRNYIVKVNHAMRRYRELHYLI